jgi:hypothetical protein
MFSWTKYQGEWCVRASQDEEPWIVGRDDDGSVEVEVTKRNGQTSLVTLEEIYAPRLARPVNMRKAQAETKANEQYWRRLEAIACK